MTIRLLAGALCLAAAVLGAHTGFAQSGETPASIEGAKTVMPDDVKGLLGKAVVVDVRKKASYLEAHLPGAKSISSYFDAEKKSFDPAAFGNDKSAAIVIYGHGSDGWSAVYAVRSAVAAGFGNVHWIRTGWSAWVERKLPVEQ